MYHRLHSRVTGLVADRTSPSYRGCEATANTDASCKDEYLLGIDGTSPSPPQELFATAGVLFLPPTEGRPVELRRLPQASNHRVDRRWPDAHHAALRPRVRAAPARRRAGRRSRLHGLPFATQHAATHPAATDRQHADVLLVHARNRDVGKRMMTATDVKRYEHAAFSISPVLRQRLSARAAGGGQVTLRRLPQGPRRRHTRR